MPTSTRMAVIENFGTCNMRCTYCFPEHMWQREGHHGVISQDTYVAALHQVFSSTSADSVDLHLAGGEPLLAGQAWLADAFTTARDVASAYRRRVTFSLQTNATMVTEELAAFLAANGVTVGVSLDGDRVINEAVRGSTDRTLAGFARLREAYGGRSPGVIVTVTRCNARRMPEVIAYLDNLDVVLFRANQMGATASWNEHAAPRAEEWAAAKQAIAGDLAQRRGRLMEFNLAQAVTKMVTALLHDAPAFQVQQGCCALRCPAGRELVYFDRQGNAYPCPRANVTPSARIGHVSDLDFELRWEDAARALDLAMQAPQECRACPAQVVCDYGCHAFNQARGNFFEVNCDATKDYYRYLRSHLEETARLFLLVSWREQQKAHGRYEAVRAGIDLPEAAVIELATELDRRLDERAAAPGIDPEVLDRRYGWRRTEVPLAVLDRPRVDGRRSRRTRAEGR
ncbi:radical SAM protein [Geodermatophilus sp. SYSU D00697]